MKMKGHIATIHPLKDSRMEWKAVLEVTVTAENNLEVKRIGEMEDGDAVEIPGIELAIQEISQLEIFKRQD